MQTASGYSGTPLAKKLGIKPGVTVALIGAPGFMTAVVKDAGATPAVAKDAKAVKAGTSIVHFFAVEQRILKAALAPLKKAIAPDGVLWVSCPKKASKVSTDITEDTIRKLALPIDLVDVKVCAIHAVWSGLKLVIRKEKR
ncbi:MAG: DUF3052 domain-containing protein [Alphaproteobacteria bacterium]|nr:DUF3052 domain-containing protein [Alphaproteobacteria bacterium]